MYAQIFTLIAAVGVAGSIAWSVSQQQSTGRTVQLRTTSADTLTQAKTILGSESSDPDGDGYKEPPAMTPLTGGPAGGGAIATSSGAPRADAWGTPLGYCPYDLGTTNASSGRITGAANPTQGSVVFVLISAGPDKTFQTSCANAAAGTRQGDDGIRATTVAQLNQGVGGTIYWGDPVANAAALNAIDKTNLPEGHYRVVLDTRQGYVYRKAAGVWELATAAGGGGGGGLQAPSYTGTPPTILMGNGMPVVGMSPGGNGNKYSFAVASDGQLYAAGNNRLPSSGYSAWGDLTTSAKLSWYPIPGAAGIKFVAPSGDRGFFVKTDNTLWASGLNTTSGALGVGDTANRSTFTQIASDVLKVQASAVNGVLQKSDGLYLWGAGNSIGTTATNLTPLKITDTSSSVRTFSLASTGGCLAKLEADGQLWVRGNAGYCSNSTSSSTGAWQPILAGVANVALGGPTAVNMYAVKSDGTLWVRGGANSDYQLGLGTTGAYASFTQTSLTDVALVAACPYAAFAVKADGSLWAAGNNMWNQFGDGASTASKTTWARITTISNVVGIYLADDCSGAFALKQDGTVWAAGVDYGHHGLGTNNIPRHTWTRVL